MPPKGWAPGGEHAHKKAPRAPRCARRLLTRSAAPGRRNPSCGMTSLRKPCAIHAFASASSLRYQKQEGIASAADMMKIHRRRASSASRPCKHIEMSISDIGIGRRRRRGASSRQTPVVVTAWLPILAGISLAARQGIALRRLPENQYDRGIARKRQSRQLIAAAILRWRYSINERCPHGD